MQIHGFSSECAYRSDDEWDDAGEDRRQQRRDFLRNDTTSCELSNGRGFALRAPMENQIISAASANGKGGPDAVVPESSNRATDNVVAKPAPCSQFAVGEHADDPSWPPSFLTQAKLAKAKGWHLLNEVTFGAWGAATATRAAIQIGTIATGQTDTLSISSHLPAGNEGALVGGIFALIEAFGTAHLIWKAGRRKGELEAVMREHTDGHTRFVNGDPARDTEITELFDEKQEIERQLKTWPRDESMTPLPEIAHASDPTAPPQRFDDRQARLSSIRSDLREHALDLVEDLEHYIQYEQAANELGQAINNVHAMGIAAARDVVIQLGANACNYAVSAAKLGAPGVDIAAAGVAGGAFGMAMGALHMGAGAVSWYQSQRRLDDVQAARNRGLVWQAAESRQQQVLRLANDPLRIPQVPAAVAQEPMAAAAPAIAPPTDPDKQADIQRANDMIEVVLHHRDQAFRVIEEDERRNIWRSKVRMAYGALSIAIGAGVIVATTVFALVPPVGLVLGAVALLAGTCWLVFGSGKNTNDRSKDKGRAEGDKQAIADAKRIVGQQGQPTIEQMRNNRFLAIEAMLSALRDRNRPVTRQALTDALIDLGMGPALLQALELGSSVRLDETYKKDREDMLKKLRCGATRKGVQKREKERLEKMIETMPLRTDEAMLEPLRHLFQDVIEGKTSMRQEYERRVGFFAFMRAKLQETFEGRPLLSAQAPDAMPDSAARSTGLGANAAMSADIVQ